MSISRTSSLVQLINSLDKSEKRHFSLYVHRLKTNRDGLFLAVFDLIESGKLSDDDALVKALKLENTQQFSNLKRHLFEQIMISLRILHSNDSILLQYHKWLDYSQLLSDKFMNAESLHFLDKCHHLIEPYSPMLETHISIMKMNMLRKLDIENNRQETIQQELSNAHLKILAHSQAEKILFDQIIDFQKNGFSRTDRESSMRLQVYKNFKAAIPNEIDSSFANACLKLAEAQCYFNCFRITECLELLDDFEALYQSDETLGLLVRDKLHQCIELKMNCLYLLARVDDFELFRLKLESNDSSTLRLDMIPEAIIQDVLLLNAKIFAAMLKNDYSYFKPGQISGLMREPGFSGLSKNRYFELAYRLAVLQSHTGHYEACLDSINLILENSSESIHKEIRAYTRLLELFCHYRLNHFEFVDNNISTLRQYFVTHALNNRITELSLQFLKKGVRALNFGLRDELNALIRKLEEYRNQSYDGVAFYYFNFITWFDSIKKDVLVKDLK